MTNTEPRCKKNHAAENAYSKFKMTGFQEKAVCDQNRDNSSVHCEKDNSAQHEKQEYTNLRKNGIQVGATNAI
jgi:hypothetical protein